MARRFKLLLPCLVVFGLWTLLAPGLATRLIVEKPLERADAIVVLSGSAAYTERVRTAAQLYRQGVSGRILITDDGQRAGWSNDERTNLQFVELERRALVAGGVPPGAIAVLPGVVSGTDDEAHAVAAEIDGRPTSSILIVTSAYHSRRALWTFERILAGRNVVIGIEAAPVGDAAPEPEYWWLYTRGWEMVAGEYMKSIAYGVRY